MLGIQSLSQTSRTFYSYTKCTRYTAVCDGSEQQLGLAVYVHLAGVDEPLARQVDLQQVGQLWLRAPHLIERRSRQNCARRSAPRTIIPDVSADTRRGLNAAEVTHLAEEARLRTSP